MRFCVDAICVDKNNNIVLVERLNNPKGLALPGGGIEEGEDKDVAVVREVKEETGLVFTVSHWLDKVYDKPGRDPRGPATSYVAVGYVSGKIKNEKNKTRVVVLPSHEVVGRSYMHKMAFDHYFIFKDFVADAYMRSFMDLM